MESFSDGRIQELTALFEGGTSIVALAAVEDVCENTMSAIVRRTGSFADAPGSAPAGRFSGDAKIAAEARRLRSEGRTVDEIRKMLHTGIPRLRRIAPEVLEHGDLDPSVLDKLVSLRRAGATVRALAEAAGMSWGKLAPMLAIEFLRRAVDAAPTTTKRRDT